MSSTNRSKSRDNHISDYYVTPINVIEEFLREFENVEPIQFDYNFNGLILDPCAGGDIKNPMSYPDAMINIGINKEQIVTSDIREDSLAKIKNDYLKHRYNDEFSVIITNPPFSLALPIIKKALSEVENGGYVIMLLRLNFFGSKERYAFFKENMPEYCFVHHKRIKFTGTNNTDSIEYAHFVWQKGYKGNSTKLFLI